MFQTMLQRGMQIHFIRQPSSTESSEDMYRGADSNLRHSILVWILRNLNCEGNETADSLEEKGTPS